MNSVNPVHAAALPQRHTLPAEGLAAGRDTGSHLHLEVRAYVGSHTTRVCALHPLPVGAAVIT